MVWGWALRWFRYGRIRRLDILDAVLAFALPRVRTIDPDSVSPMVRALPAALSLAIHQARPRQINER